LGLAGNNIITVLMKNKDLDIQAASNFVGKHYKHLMQSYVHDKSNLPSFDDASTDKDVARYIEAMQHWPIGNIVSISYYPRTFGSDLGLILRYGVSRPRDTLALYVMRSNKLSVYL
jgi:hypothetical protein